MTAWGDLDTLGQIHALEQALAGADAAELYAAAVRARVAAGCRGADEPIGLGAPDPQLVETMTALADRALERAAELGHVPAGVEVASRIYAAQQRDRAAEALRLLERAGEEPRAQRLLGYLHFAGFGVPKDDARSLACHRRAAERGDADALFELYVYLSTGIGGERDEAQAIAFCLRAAEAGSARAMCNVGGFHATGRGLERDPALAAAWYERAAHAGSGRAAATLGIMRASGDGLEPDPAEARRWFAAAADLGYPWESMAEECGLDPADYE